MRSAVLFVLCAAVFQVAAAYGDLPPFRSPDGPGAPNWTAVGAPPGAAERHGTAGMNAPANQNGDFLIGPDYLPAPEWKFVPGTPQGAITQFTLESKDSKYYPGIARDAAGIVDPKNPKTMIVKTHAQPWQRAITVYVPAQYKSGTEAPLLVVHDGPKLGFPDTDFAHVLDNLINQHRVPAMIAIMIQNGGGDMQGSERGLEYDTVSGKFAEFVEHEVLPQVEARYHIQLTHDPDGRAAMGCSSGAAAAFTMAWFHPEWYHRVISYSGTFVNQQWPYNPAIPDGAWDYHERLIASTKPKPIRIWMQAADQDLLNPNVMRDGMHDWVVANHRMAAVLEKKGYQYQYVFTLNAGHCAPKVRVQTLPEALEWVWQGYSSGRAHQSQDLVLFEQPDTTNLAEHFFVPPAGPPPHRQGPEGVFSLYLWEPNPYREDGKLGPASWRAGDKTGFYPRDVVHGQRGFQDKPGTTTAQAENGVVGAYLNPEDETPATDFGKMMITPVIRWPESQAQRPFTNATNIIEVEMDLQVPTASSASKAGSISYIVADLELMDQTSRTKISYGCALFFHQHDELKDYPIGYDAPSNSVVANVPVMRGNPRITVLPGSALYTGTTWRGWRTYRFAITAENLRATLAALRRKSPDSKASGNLADYELTMYHLNAEINHSSAPAELGWSLRNTRILLHTEDKS